MEKDRKKIFSFFPRFILGALLTGMLAFFTPATVVAQTKAPRFFHLTTAEGLSHDVVCCIVQDHFGFVWFGTQGGLNRYDGNSFVQFRHLRSQPDSINNDTINVLYEDSHAELWIGTVSGLNRLAPDRKSFIQYGEIYESVQAILEDSEGLLWIGTAGSGLFRYDRTTGEFRQYLHDPTNENSLSDNHINALTEDKEGIIWIGTEYGGLNKYDRDADDFTVFNYSSNAPFSLPDERVTSLLTEPNGVLWVGTGSLQDEEQGGVVTYVAQQMIFTRRNLGLSNISVTSLALDKTGTLWIGSLKGLITYDPLNQRITRYQHNPTDPSSLCEDKINDIYTDESGVLWIATDGGGINKYAPAKERFQRYQADPVNTPSLKQAPVGALLKDHSGMIWVGYHNGGLDWYDRSTGDIRHYTHEDDSPQSLSHNHITALYEDQNHNLWIGTSLGLDRYDPAKGVFTHYSYDEANPRSIAAGAIKVILQDKAGQFWIGTEEPGTLNLFEPENGLFTRYIHESDLPTSMIETYGVRALLQDRQGDLWLGTYNGLVYFDLESGIFTQYRHDPTNPYSLSDDFVWSLHQGRDDTLWIGTHNGLNALNLSNEEFTVYTIEDGLPDDSIVSILEDEQGNLWLATMGGGISKFNPYSKSFKNFDISDGLQGNSFIIGSAFRSQDGEMFFGGIDGFNAFYPKDIRENSHIPPLAFTTFRKFDQILSFEKDINDLEEIQLSYRDSFFAFEFAALDFTDPARNQYAYRLEGFDSDWVYSGNRNFASYTNIPPGRYVFRVKGSNNDGVWNEQGISIRVHIIPLVWQTTWFQLLAVVTLSGFAFLLVRARLQQVKALTFSEERFRSLFENAPLGVCEVDLSVKPARVTHVNHQWESLFQRGINESEGIALLGLFPVEEHPKVEQELSALQEQRTVSMETKGLRADGSEFPIRISVAALGKDSPNCMMVIEDITIEKERRSEEEAIVEERRRIAQEIHDGLAQDLAAIRLQTRRWKSLVDSNPEKAKAELDWLHDLLGEKIREVRSVIFALRPVALDELGFWPALERFITEFGEQNQLAIHLEVSGERERLPFSLEPLLFRIVQEVLHNVARHAQARGVWIMLDFSQGLTLTVRDDGIGFDISKLSTLSREGHLGLQQMRERVEALGGSLEIVSQPGVGTKVIVKLGDA